VNDDRTLSGDLLHKTDPEVMECFSPFTCGLLPAPVSIPGQGLVLASAERADLLVDFSDLAAGTQLTLWNTATAPFDGTVCDSASAGRGDLDGLLPYPQVLRIRVGEGRRSRRSVPEVLATDFRRTRRDELSGAVVRAIALVEQEAEGAPPMLSLRPMLPRGVQRVALRNA
jgi:hypothetical protein